MSNPHGIPNSAPVAKSLGHNRFPMAVPELSPALTLASVLAELRRRRDDAERVHATAPVAAVLADVLNALEALPLAPSAPLVAPLIAPLADESVQDLLRPPEAAKRLGVTVRWLYRNASALPFTRRLTRRALRFDAVGLRRWVGSRK